MQMNQESDAMDPFGGNALAIGQGATSAEEEMPKGFSVRKEELALLTSIEEEVYRHFPHGKMTDRTAVVRWTFVQRGGDLSGHRSRYHVSEVNYNASLARLQKANNTSITLTPLFQEEIPESFEDESQPEAFLPSSPEPASSDDTRAWIATVKSLLGVENAMNSPCNSRVSAEAMVRARFPHLQADLPDEFEIAVLALMNHRALFSRERAGIQTEFTTARLALLANRANKLERDHELLDRAMAKLPPSRPLSEDPIFRRAAGALIVTAIIAVGWVGWNTWEITSTTDRVEALDEVAEAQGFDNASSAFADAMRVNDLQDTQIEILQREVAGKIADQEKEIKTISSDRANAAASAAEAADQAKAAAGSAESAADNATTALRLAEGIKTQTRTIVSAQVNAFSCAKIGPSVIRGRTEWQCGTDAPYTVLCTGEPPNATCELK